MGDALFITWSNTINLGAAIIAALLGLITLGGAWYAVRRKNRIEGLTDDVGRWKDTAARWETERDAAVSNAERLTAEVTGLRVQLAQAETAHTQAMASHTAEQTELRHDLKQQVRLLELKTDQTPVFEGLKAILERMNSAESSGVATVAQLLDGMEERAAKRDAALLGTQQEIAASIERSNALLERLTEKVTASVTASVAEKVDQAMQQVGDVVQEKVDQLQPPDSKP